MPPENPALTYFQNEVVPLPQLLEHYGEWLDRYRWAAWATLTFRWNPSPKSALESFRRWLLGPRVSDSYVLEEGASDRPQRPLWVGGEPYFFVATEEGKLNGRTHLHALLGTNRGRLDRRIGFEEWFHRNGRARILPYDQGRGASFYISKYVIKEFGEYEVGGKWKVLPAENRG